MGNRRIQMVGALPWLLVGLVCSASTRKLCSALAALLGPVQNNIYLTVHYFNSFVPSAQQAGQAAVCWVACLLGCVSGYRAERRVDKSCSIRDQSGRDADISSIYQGYSHNSND
jgi:hypothetical protein